MLVLHRHFNILMDQGNRINRGAVQFLMIYTQIFLFIVFSQSKM